LTKTPKFKTGDVVKCIDVGTGYYVGKLTKGKEYNVVRGYLDGEFQDMVDVMGDHGYLTSPFSSRFKKVEARQIPVIKRGTWLVDKQRQERKEAEAARKAKGKARAEAMQKALFNVDFGPLEQQVLDYFRYIPNWMSAPYGGQPKKPLLFTSLTEEDVHTALANYIRPKLGLNLRVMDLDKTTEGYKLTVVGNA
jgi:hypothetical protein